MIFIDSWPPLRVVLSPVPCADIRSWWEVPCIAHFCHIFQKPLKLPEFEIEVSGEVATESSS